MNLIAMIAGYAALSLAFVGLICIALAPKPPRLEDDQVTPEKPYLPPQVRKAMSLRDRLEGSSDLRERRAKWAARQEIERMAYDVERGVEP